jgi:omega-amidase
MRVALVSLDQIWLDKDRNFQNCSRFVQQASEQECELIVFPEMTLTGFAVGEKNIVENAKSSKTLKRFAMLSERFNICIVYGACILLEGNEKPSNVLCYSVPAKQSVILYSKCHLFSYAAEDQHMMSGTGSSILEFSGTKIGLAICYDLRFPGFFSSMNNSCDGFLIIANWPDKRTEHWNTLLKARAIENLGFIMGVNRTGHDGNGLKYEESTHVYMPNGEVLNAEYQSEQLHVFDIDITEARNQRLSFPTIADRRPELY